MQSKNNEGVSEDNFKDLSEQVSALSEAIEYFRCNTLEWQYAKNNGEEYKKHKSYKNHVDLYNSIMCGDFENLCQLKNYLINKEINDDVLGIVIFKIVFEDLDKLYEVKKSEYKNNEHESSEIPLNCELKSVSIPKSNNIYFGPYGLIDYVFERYMYCILDRYGNDDSEYDGEYDDDSDNYVYPNDHPCIDNEKNDDGNKTEVEEFLEKVISNGIDQFDIDPVYLAKYFSLPKEKSINRSLVCDFYENYLSNKICVKKYSKDSFGILLLVLLARNCIIFGSQEYFEAFLFSLNIPEKTSIKDAFSKLFSSETAAVTEIYDKKERRVLFFAADSLGEEFAKSILLTMFEKLDYEPCLELAKFNFKHFKLNSIASDFFHNHNSEGCDNSEEFDNSEKFDKLVAFYPFFKNVNSNAEKIMCKKFESLISNFESNFENEKSNYQTFEEINKFYRIISDILGSYPEICNRETYKTIKMITKKFDANFETDINGEKKPLYWYRDELIEAFDWLEELGGFGVDKNVEIKDKHLNIKEEEKKEDVSNIKNKESSLKEKTRKVKFAISLGSKKKNRKPKTTAGFLNHKRYSSKGDSEG